MLVCFACHEGRVAALLETCSELCVHALERDGTRLLLRLPPPGDGLAGYPALLAGLAAKVLVCGAVGRNWEIFLRQNGVRLKPWFTGRPEALLRTMKPRRASPGDSPRAVLPPPRRLPARPRPLDGNSGTSRELP